MRKEEVNVMIGSIPCIQFVAILHADWSASKLMSERCGTGTVLSVSTHEVVRIIILR